MLIQQTIENLKTLRLNGVIQALEDQRNNSAIQSLDFDERLGLLVDAEISERKNNRLRRILKSAKLKVNACLEDVDYQASRGLDRKVMANLSTCDWIEKSLNTIITGSTGVGKTWLGCALGHQAARKGYSVTYKRLSRLLEELEIAYADGSLAKKRMGIAKVDLLILDDWGLAPVTARGRQELLEIIDDRIGSGSVLIASQFPVADWHEFLGEPTIADAILDRLVHRAHRIELRGDNMRKIHDEKAIDTAKV